MRPKFATVAAAAVAATAMAVTLPGVAEAAPAPSYVSCSTPGGWGGVTIYDWHGPDATVRLSMTVYDTSADSAHMRIRFISKDTRGTIKYWPWRSNTQGANTDQTWNTTASHDGGLFNAGVQVARFDGSTIKNACAKWV